MSIKKNRIIKPQPFRLTDTPVSGTSDLIPYTWKNRVIKITDRDFLPFFPTVGMLRTVSIKSIGFDGTDSIEPPNCWGRTNHLLKPPKAVILTGFQSTGPGSVIDIYPLITADNIFMQKLADAKIIVINGQVTNGNLPVSLNYFPTDSDGNVQTTFDGGEVLILTAGAWLGDNVDVIDITHGTEIIPIFTLNDPLWSDSLNILAADILPNFIRFGMRNYLTALVDGESTYVDACNAASTQLLSIGVIGLPEIFAGSNLGPVDSLIKTDILTFFGIL